MTISDPRSGAKAAAPDRPDASPWAALRDRNYRLFWTGGLVSNIGRWFQSLAVPVIVWQLTESPAWVGFAGFSRMAPMALVSPWAGALADRFDRRSLLFVTQSLQAVATGLLLMAWLAGIRNAGTYVALSALAGAFGGLNLPAWKAFTNDLVPRDRLLNAITLNSMQFNASRMFGPALAGITVAALGPAWAFGINFVSFGAVLIALALIRIGRTVSDDPAPFRPLRDFVETLVWIRDQPGIRQSLVTVAFIGFFGLPVQVLAVVFAEDVFDSGEQAFGVMITMVGLGAVSAGPFVAGRGTLLPRSRLMSIGLCGYGFGLVAFALSPNLIAASAALFVVGASHLTSTSTLNTAQQMQASKDRLAKVLSVHTVAVTLSSPIGQLVLGRAMTDISPRLTMTIAGLALLVAAAMFIGFGRFKSLDVELPTDELVS